MFIGRANVDMLEETRLQMQMMQENFIRIEAGLNAEIEQLNVQLQNNASKSVQYSYWVLPLLLDNSRN